MKIKDTLKQLGPAVTEMATADICAATGLTVTQVCNGLYALGLRRRPDVKRGEIKAKLAAAVKNNPTISNHEAAQIAGCSPAYAREFMAGARKDLAPSPLRALRQRNISTLLMLALTEPAALRQQEVCRVNEAVAKILNNLQYASS